MKLSFLCDDQPNFPSLIRFIGSTCMIISMLTGIQITEDYNSLFTVFDIHTELTNVILLMFTSITAGCVIMYATSMKQFQLNKVRKDALSGNVSLLSSLVHLLNDIIQILFRNRLLSSIPFELQRAFALNDALSSVAKTQSSPTYVNSPSSTNLFSSVSAYMTILQTVLSKVCLRTNKKTATTSFNKSGAL